MAYDLNALAVKDKPFRVITPLSTHEGELLRLYVPILTHWRTTAGTLLALYATQDATALQAEADNSDKEIAIFLALMALRFTDLFGRVETWHRAKWIGNVKAASGVGVTWMLGAQETPVKAAVASSLVQARALSDEARNRITNAVIGGKRAGLSAADVTAEINKGLKLGRARARRMAENELDNAIKTMTDARMAEAGLTMAAWRHYTPRERARLWHLAKDGNHYAVDDPIWQELYLPNCRCAKRPVLTVKKAG